MFHELDHCFLIGTQFSVLLRFKWCYTFRLTVIFYVLLVPLTTSFAGAAQFSTADLEVALQFCTHVIYGYVGIKPDTFQLMSLNENLDIQRRHFATITALKEKFPYIKFLLSVGGDRDVGGHEKYINLLEGGRQKQTAFIDSVRDFLRSYNFDGIDLAFQLPRNKPRKVHSDTGAVWKSFKKFFTGDFIVDEKANEHKEEFTDLVKDLKNTLRTDNLLLSLTVLPNVNSSCKYLTKLHL